MINFNIPNAVNESAADNSQVIQEGKFKDFVDTVKNTAVGVANKDPDKGGMGIDTDQIGKDWNSGGVLDKIGVAGRATGSVADSLDDKLNASKSRNQIDGRSIVARARNSVKQCPIYVTQTIRATEAHLLAQTFEKVYVTFFQAAISQNPIISRKEANNLGFMNKFHTDIREAAEKIFNDLYEPIDDFDSMMQESVFSEHQLSDKCRVRFSVVPASDKDARRLIVENARLMNEPLTGLSYLYYEANSYYSGSGEGNKSVGGKSDSSVDRNQEILRVDENDIIELAKHRLSQEDLELINKGIKGIEDDIDAAYPLPTKPITSDKTVIADWQQKLNDINDRRATAKATKISSLHNAQSNMRIAIDAVKNDIKSGKYNNATNGFIYYDGNTKSYFRKKLTQKKSNKTVVTAAPPEILKQTDIKKINGMEPYMMKASFIISDPDEKTDHEVSYLIGIKSVMHLIYVQDLADELYELVTGNIKSLQKVRYKTGEIKWADYMFNIKGLKADAAKDINYDKRWISTLKQLADYNRMNGSMLKKPAELLLNGSVPIPNATLILSQPDVLWLVNKTGIDLSQISNARRLAKNLFLIAIAIVDSSAGSMRVFFPDRDTDWDVQSLASIDAEVSKTDNSNLMRELQKAVNR